MWQYFSTSGHTEDTRAVWCASSKSRFVCFVMISKSKKYFHSPFFYFWQRQTAWLSKSLPISKVGRSVVLWTRSWCYKNFLRGNLDFSKFKILNKIYSDDWTCTKMLTQCYFKLNYIRTLLICSKMANSCCFS